MALGGHCATPARCPHLRSGRQLPPRPQCSQGQRGEGRGRPLPSKATIPQLQVSLVLYPDDQT